MHSIKYIKVMLCLITGVTSFLLGSFAFAKSYADNYGDTCADHSLARSNGNIIKVSAGGSIQAAMNKAKPGDTIVLACGTYNQSPALKNSGTAKGWINIRPERPLCAKINGDLRIVKSDYIRIVGLEIVNSRLGVLASHHIEIVKNLITNGGMVMNLSDFLLLDGNEVYGASKYYNLVSILNPQNITGDTTTRNRIIVRNNIIHHNKWSKKTDGAGLIFDNGIERQLTITKGPTEKAHGLAKS